MAEASVNDGSLLLVLCEWERQAVSEGLIGPEEKKVEEQEPTLKSLPQLADFDDALDDVLTLRVKRQARRWISRWNFQTSKRGGA